jgi:hypothetical protein
MSPQACGVNSLKWVNNAEGKVVYETTSRWISPYWGLSHSFQKRIWVRAQHFSPQYRELWVFSRRWG